MNAVKIGDTIEFMYDAEKRKVIVEGFFFGSNACHKEPQFILNAFDVHLMEIRTFAAKDISELKVYAAKET